MKNKKKVEEAVNAFRKTDETSQEINTDVLGSYTGTTKEDEAPEQDSDDI